MADHDTKSIVITIRGSFSFRDIFTDLTADSERFEAPGMPPDSAAHRGMVAGVEQLMKRLRETNVLDRAFTSHPEYSLVLTGHSLGECTQNYHNIATLEKIEGSSKILSKVSGFMKRINPS